MYSFLNVTTSSSLTCDVLDDTTDDDDTHDTVQDVARLPRKYLFTCDLKIPK